MCGQLIINSKLILPNLISPLQRMRRKPCVCVLYRENSLMFLICLHFYVFSKVWDRSEEFIPERFDLEGPAPNESNTDYRCVRLLVFPVCLISLNAIHDFFHLPTTDILLNIQVFYTSLVMLVLRFFIAILLTSIFFRLQ